MTGMWGGVFLTPLTMHVFYKASLRALFSKEIWENVIQNFILRDLVFTSVARHHLSTSITRNFGDDWPRAYPPGDGQEKSICGQRGLLYWFQRKKKTSCCGFPSRLMSHFNPISWRTPFGKKKKELKRLDVQRCGFYGL